jgi:hypothetical protein
MALTAAWLLESNTSGKSAIGDTHKTEKSLKLAVSEERALRSCL